MMDEYILSFKKFLLSVPGLIDRLCRVNPKYTKEVSQQEIAHKRNKTFVFMYACIISTYILDMIVNGVIMGNLIRIFVSLSVIVTMFISCHYHPQIFQCLYNFMCLLYGPMTMNGGAEGISTAFIFVHMIPQFIQLTTGSIWHFIIQAIFQNIFLHTLYQKRLEQLINFASPDTVLQSFTHSSNLTMIIQTILTVLSHYSLQQAYETALIYEKKKNEAENQKTFLLGFSHELRNLINSLIGNIKLASLESLSIGAKELIGNAEVCGELLLHLINNILDTGKTEIGELEINPVPTRTYDTLEKIWGICSELIRRKDLRGFMKIPKNMPQTLMIDHHRLTQILLNLVGNAVKYTDSGSIDINIKWIKDMQEVTESCFQPYPFNSVDDQDEGLFEKQKSFFTLHEDHVTLTTTSRIIKKTTLTPANDSHKGVLKITVSDTGCGMNQEQTEKIFHKFIQISSDVSKRKLGTGLGLFITRQLCQKMQGEVKVYTKKDEGSSFIVCIPAQAIQQTNEQLLDLESMRAFVASKKLRAMIVDDASFNQVVLNTFFEKLGIEVVDICVNGYEGYNRYANHVMMKRPPEIVAMDLDMPVMDGKEASQKIRELEVSKGINPCCLLVNSGNCVESEINECLDERGQIRADAFLKKPVRIEDLIRIFATHFAQNRFQRMR